MRIVHKPWWKSTFTTADNSRRRCSRPFWICFIKIALKWESFLQRYTCDCYTSLGTILPLIVSCNNLLVMEHTDRRAHSTHPSMQMKIIFGHWPMPMHPTPSLVKHRSQYPDAAWSSNRPSQRVSTKTAFHFRILFHSDGYGSVYMGLQSPRSFQWTKTTF